ncbi:leucine-rich repeat domain-containing protein [Zooshikella sp. RANM57]|uniref:leucine-rich repeat domain-containing protein n=1 Tax=Zooshikella sp. RANM57 TaxID=3425863 RepID=UPI003D6DCD8A
MSKLKANVLSIVMLVMVISFSGCDSSPDIVISESIANIKFKDENFQKCIEKYHYKRTEEVIKITCWKQGITHVDELKKFSLLEELKLTDNEIKHVDLSGNEKLKIFWGSGNKIESINLSKNTELEQLWLSNNNLTEIDISKNINLKQLLLDGNKLVSVDILNNKKVYYIDASDNNIKDIEVTNEHYFKYYDIYPYKQKSNDDMNDDAEYFHVKKKY